MFGLSVLLMGLWELVQILSFEFRLARFEDDRLEIIEEVLTNAKDYCERSKDKSLRPIEIVRAFQAFAQGNANEPQYWIALGDGHAVGYMLTRFVENDGDLGLQIWQGYLQTKWRGERNAYECVKIVEEQAKKWHCDFATYLTHRNSWVYERWAKRIGYELDYVNFKKRF